MNAIMSIEQLSKPALALDIPKDQTFEQWEEMGRSLAEGQRVVNWWIGDWWLAGERKYGEAKAAASALEIFGKEYGTVRKCGWVCAAVESVRRRTDLTFSHHEEVARLPAREQDRLLDKARTADLSTRELRVEAMKRKVALGLFKPRDEVDDDPEYTALKAIAAAWNRAPVGARRTFAELIAESDYGVIDP